MPTTFERTDSRVEARAEGAEPFQFNRTDAAHLALLFGFLLIYFFPFIVPNSALFQIGNDFAHLYANYATYFVDAVRAGFLPLWNPNEGCGFPFFSNPFTAFLYPARMLWFVLAWRSPLYSWYHHQVYMVIGIGILAAGLYVWLRERRAEPAAAFFAAGVIAIGYRVADIYRFPNAIHAVAWMPWVLFAYDRWLSGRLVSGFWLGVAALFCLTTAGYPYYVFYFPLLIGSYSLLRVFEGVRSARAALALLSLGVPLALLVGPYYGAIAQMLAQTVDRTGTSYTFSTQHGWTYLDLLGGLVFPMSAVSEGWLYCGILPVLLTAVWICVQRPSSSAFVWVLTLAFTVQLVAAGSTSFAFPAIWTLVPGASGLRVWSRMTIILLPGMALLVALAYSSLASPLERPDNIRKWMWRIAAVVTFAQIVLWATRTYSSYLADFPNMQAIAFIVATFVAVLYLLFWTSRVTRRGTAWALLALIVTASDTGQFGRQIWRASVGAQIPRTSLHLRGYYAQFFDRPRTAGVGTMIPYEPTSGVMANWFYERYVDFVEKYKDRAPFQELVGAQGRKIFFSASLDAPPQQFEQWWSAREEFDRSAQTAATVTAPYNGNELEIAYRLTRPGYIIVVDNWDPNWHAWVGSTEVSIERAFGTFKAVHLEAGSGSITFRYRPRLPRWWTSLIGLALLIAVPIFGRAL
jgi:hypothetical protein